MTVQFTSAVSTGNPGDISVFVAQLRERTLLTSTQGAGGGGLQKLTKVDKGGGRGSPKVDINYGDK